MLVAVSAATIAVSAKLVAKVDSKEWSAARLLRTWPWGQGAGPGDPGVPRGIMARRGSRL
eukprot:9546967-Alexandrium_andersonii.AAC.1